MLEQITNLVKEFGQDSVVNNAAVPNSQNNEVLAEAASTVTGGLQGLLASGGLQDIIALFTGGGANKQGGIGGLLKNPIVATMVTQLISKLTSKFNMAPAQASNVAESLIPNVLNGLVTRTTSNAPENDAFDLNDLIGSLTGGNVATKESSSGGFDFQGLLNQFTGGGSGKSDGFDLSDIIGQVTKGAQQKQDQSSTEEGGGVADLLKGLFN